jgi:hypothetical protein
MLALAIIFILITALFRVESAVAISNNELMTSDGNVWAVYDELEVDRQYIVTFSNNNTETIYDDIIVNVK